MAATEVPEIVPSPINDKKKKKGDQNSKLLVQEFQTNEKKEIDLIKGLPKIQYGGILREFRDEVLRDIQREQKAQKILADEQVTNNPTNIQLVNAAMWY